MWPHIDIYACTTLHVQVITAYSVTYDTYTTINHDMYAYIIYLFICTTLQYIITSIQTNKNDYSTLLQSTVYSLQYLLKKKY